MVQASNNTPTRKTTTLYCFTPPVMVATLLIELALAVYTFFRYRRGMFGKVAVAVLVLLAMFQLSEYQVCQGTNTFYWSRFGLVAITLLPVLLLYLVSMVTKQQRLLRIGYFVAAVFAATFILAPENTISSFCGGNYVVFSGPKELYQFYGAYYFGFLMFGIWETIEAMRNSERTLLRLILRWVIIGYLSFLLPMGIAYAIYPPARYAVASIMCGFAVTFAFILVFQIVPKYYGYTTSEKKN